MNSKKANVKKILYIVLLILLTTLFISSLTFGAIAAFSPNVRENIEVWFSTKYEKNISLLKASIIWLLISSFLLTLTLSFKEFKIKYID